MAERWAVKRQVTRMRTEILMLTHNRRDELERCLNSLMDSGAVSWENETGLTIIDNGSEQDTVKWLLRWAHEQSDANRPVTVIAQQENLGVARGRNRLVQQAKAYEPERLVFLDSDVEIVDRHWLHHLFTPMYDITGNHWVNRTETRADPIVEFNGTVQPRAVGIVGCAGSNLDWTRGAHPFVPAPKDSICHVVSGWCMAVRADLFYKANLRFDEGYGLFWEEDSDLCMAARELGFLVANVGDIGVKHTPGLSGAAKTANRRKALWRFQQKWHPEKKAVAE